MAGSKSPLVLIVTAIALSSGIAILVAELALRAFMADRINLFPRFHDTAEYGDYRIRRFLPGAKFKHTSVDGQWQFEINQRGFRDDSDYAYEKPEGVARILVLGDSHTAGFEVHRQDMFTARLQRRLDRTSDSWDVINTGVSGFGTVEELVYLENEGYRYSPDIVVLAFFANDYSDNIKAGLFELGAAGELVNTSYEHLPGMRIQDVLNDHSILQWLSQNSYLYSFAFNTAYEAAKRLLLTRKRQQVTTRYAISLNDVEAYEADVTIALLRRLKIATTAIGATLVIVDIPNTAQNARVRSSFTTLHRNSISKIADVYLDAEEMFESFRGNHDAIHVEHGHRHLSTQGHRVIADHLFDVVTETIAFQEPNLR